MELFYYQQLLDEMNEGGGEVKKVLFTVWGAIIMAIMLSVVLGAWWINRDPVLLAMTGVIIAIGIFLLRNLLP